MTRFDAPSVDRLDVILIAYYHSRQYAKALASGFEEALPNSLTLRWHQWSVRSSIVARTRS